MNPDLDQAAYGNQQFPMNGNITISADEFRQLFMNQREHQVVTDQRINALLETLNNREQENGKRRLRTPMPKPFDGTSKGTKTLVLFWPISIHGWPLTAMKT